MNNKILTYFISVNVFLKDNQAFLSFTKMFYLR